MTNPPTGRRRAQRGPRTDSRTRPPAVVEPTQNPTIRGVADALRAFANYRRTDLSGIAEGIAAGMASMEAAAQATGAALRPAGTEFTIRVAAVPGTVTWEPGRPWGPTPEATARARETLLRFLTPEQRATYTDPDRRYIDCVGSHDTRYRIYTGGGISGNVYWYTDDGIEGGAFCCAPQNPNGKLPREDLFFGQLALLMADEIRWLSKAVRDEGDYPPAYKALIPSRGRCPCGCDFLADDD